MSYFDDVVELEKNLDLWAADAKDYEEKLDRRDEALRVALEGLWEIEEAVLHASRYADEGPDTEIYIPALVKIENLIAKITDITGVQDDTCTQD